MKKSVLFIFVLFMGLIIYNFATLKLAYRYYINPCYYDAPIKQQDFPQKFLEIDLADYYQQIQLSSDSMLVVDTLTTVQFQTQSYPILAITKKVENPNKKLLIFAGVHGNESGGTLAILPLLKDINRNPARYKGWAIKIVTPINPAGTSTMSRYNEVGCDLNRKIASSQQKGIVLQREIIASFQPEIVISLHEAPSEGFLIHPGQQLSETLLLDLQRQGVELSSQDYLGRSLNVPGISKVEGVLKSLKKMANVQSLGDYLAQNNIIEITTETGWNSLDTFKRVDSHFLLMGSVVDHYEN